MAGYKRPRSFSFMRDEDMPRTATGKNLHRKLKAMLLRLRAYAGSAERPSDIRGRTRWRRAPHDLNADHNSCAAWIARFLKARGVDRIFGLQGGHIQPIWDHAAQLGIRIIDVRHEVAAVHMAHAHAELTGELGVAMVTAGPGVTNTVDGGRQRLARSRARAGDRRLHLARASQHGPAAGYPACRDPAAGITAVAHACASPDQVIREFDEGVAPRVRRPRRAWPGLSRNPHRRVAHARAGESRPRGVDATEEAARHPTRSSDRRAGG